MKRLLLALGVLGMAMILACSWLDWHNNIEYPVGFGLLKEQPGDPITLTLAFDFQDETLDTSGVDFDWSKSGDTLWFLLKGKDGEIDHNGSYRSRLDVNVGVLEKGAYTLLLEGERGAQDALTLTVEDSSYYLSGYDGSVAKLWAYDTLRRLFPDMLLVEVAWYSSTTQEEYFDSLKLNLVNLGAVECSLSPGNYSIFLVRPAAPISGNRDWYDAGNNGWFDGGTNRVFAFNGDTADLGDLFDKYKERFQALSFRMGNGFDRLFEIWNNLREGE